MKNFLWAILFLSMSGIAGVLYRNAVEHPMQQIVCPLDAEVCPDGTTVSRTGSSCSFPTCPLPNVSLASAGIAFAIPEGFTASTLPDVTSIATYASSIASSTIVIRRYAVNASTTPLVVIQRTAINGATGLPAPVTAYSSVVFEAQRFTVVSIERSEGVVDTAYYLAQDSDVLRFDAIDAGVSNWSDSNLIVSKLPAHQALTKLLKTLKVL